MNKNPNKTNTGIGAIILDGIQVGETRQCCHCNAHFEVVPSVVSVVTVPRGFCRLCMAMTCGSQACMSHMAFEEKLDLYEKGKLLVL